MKVCKSGLNWMTASLKRYETTENTGQDTGVRWFDVSAATESPARFRNKLLQVSLAALF